jgi:hypothetical protein
LNVPVGTYRKNVPIGTLCSMFQSEHWRDLGVADSR